MDAASTTAHFDTGQVTGYETRPNGDKVYFGVVSQADSILKYRQKDGKIRKEICLSDELFKPESTDTLRLVPYCSPHPTYGLTVRKADRKGYTGSRIGANEGGTHLMVDYVVSDKAIQRKTDSGDLGGLSVGYTCWHQPVTGGVVKDAIRRCIDEEGGGIYGSPDKAREVLTRLDSQFEDGETIYLQRDRRYYHLAGVNVPRATDACPMTSFRLDSGEDIFTTVVQIPHNIRKDTASKPPQEVPAMGIVAVRLDGQSINTDSPEQVEAANDKLLKLRKDNVDLKAKVDEYEEKKEDEDKMYDMAYEAKDGTKMTARVSEAGKAMYDRMKADMGMMHTKADEMEKELTQHRTDAAAAELVSLKTTVSKAMGIKMDAMEKMTTPKDVHLAVIGVHNKMDAKTLTKFSERSDETLAAMFEQILLTRADAAKSASADDKFRHQKELLDGVIPQQKNPSVKNDRGMGTGYPEPQQDGKKKRYKMAPLRMTAK